MKKRKSKSWLIKLIGFFLLLLGICLIAVKALCGLNNQIKEEQAIDNFYITFNKKVENLNIKEVKENKNNYIAVLKIPKINLEKGLVNPDSYYNDVNFNIEFLDSSSMPDENNGNVILASHSGNSNISYFKNLHKLSVDDEIIIYYQKESYFYKVVNIYDVQKTGVVEINRNMNISTLTLITCKHNSDKQLVIIAEMYK